MNVLRFRNFRSICARCWFWTCSMQSLGQVSPAFTQSKQVKILTCGDWALRFSPSVFLLFLCIYHSIFAALTFLSLMAAITHCLLKAHSVFHSYSYYCLRLAKATTVAFEVMVGHNSPTDWARESVKVSSDWKDRNRSDEFKKIPLHFNEVSHQCFRTKIFG